MNKLLLLAAALGLAACSPSRAPTDAQLATLLASERAEPGAPNAPLDGRSIECLRAWSGDAGLLKGLSVRYAGEDGKQACRGSLETRLGEAARNPEKFTFAEVTAPATVRRAIALQEARRLAALANPAQRQPPAAMTPRVPGAKLAPPDPNVELGVAGTRLSEAEELCRQAQQAAVGNPDLRRFATYCTSSLRRLRSNMESTARNGLGADQLDAYARSADNLANTARELLAAPQP